MACCSWPVDEAVRQLAVARHSGSMQEVLEAMAVASSNLLITYSTLARLQVAAPCCWRQGAAKVQGDTFLCYESSSEGQSAGGASCKGVFSCPSGAADQIGAEKCAVWQQHATQQWCLALLQERFHGIVLQSKCTDFSAECPLISE